MFPLNDLNHHRFNSQKLARRPQTTLNSSMRQLSLRLKIRPLLSPRQNVNPINTSTKYAKIHQFLEMEQGPQGQKLELAGPLIHLFPHKNRPVLRLCGVILYGRPGHGLTYGLLYQLFQVVCGKMC